MRVLRCLNLVDMILTLKGKKCKQGLLYLISILLYFVINGLWLKWGPSISFRSISFIWCQRLQEYLPFTDRLSLVQNATRNAANLFFFLPWLKRHFTSYIDPRYPSIKNINLHEVKTTTTESSLSHHS